MKTKFAGKLRKEQTLLRKADCSSVCAFLLPGEILPDEGFRNFTKVLGKQLSAFVQ